jgi:hypothetical protein
MPLELYRGALMRPGATVERLKVQLELDWSMRRSVSGCQRLPQQLGAT